MKGKVGKQQKGVCSSCGCENCNCGMCKRYSRCALKALGSSVLTLILYALIVNFAPIGIANIFLNPMGVAKGLQYIQEQEYTNERNNISKGFKKILAERKGEIFDKKSPFLGAANAQIEVVVFTDYKCGYCRGTDEVIAKILNDKHYKGKVKFIMKEFPILGQSSMLSAMAAIEAFTKNPASYAKVHHALFASNPQTKEDIIAVVKKAGVTITLEDNKEVMNMISSNLSLGSEIGVRGTPAIIIGDEFIGGFIAEQEFRSKLDIELTK